MKWGQTAHRQWEQVPSLHGHGHCVAPGSALGPQGRLLSSTESFWMEAEAFKVTATDGAVPQLWAHWEKKHKTPKYNCRNCYSEEFIFILCSGKESSTWSFNGPNY